MAVNRLDLEVHIEELVLDGFPADGRDDLAGAVEAELGRLFADSGLPDGLASGTSVELLDGGAFDTSASERPNSLGARIGHSVYQSLESLHGEGRHS